MDDAATALRELGTGLRAEARGWRWRHSRNLEALRPVVSVALAVAACHALRLPDSWWGAITAFTVMQASGAASLYRGVLRVLGTIAGAALAWWLGPLLAHHSWAFVLGLALVAWLGLFCALALRHGYAWVLALVTFAMVACQALQADGVALAQFARDRVANVAVGSASCMLVAWLADLASRRTAPGDAPWRAAPAPADLRPNAARHAAQGAVAVAVLALILLAGELRHFAQAMVTTVAVLVVPLEGLASDPVGSVLRRMVQRVAGCLLAIALAGLLLPWISGHPPACQLALAAGVWCAAYLQSGSASARYAAIQFGVGFIMVFVQDHGWRMEEAPVLQRMGGMLAGMAVLSLVMAAAGRRTATSR
ncbi:FUSC family protein [Variovorax sp.]|uniref:FUSC family protein n=1 Tax=Variovorax sp. TaxID=1871043 RepID=UPI002D343D74|nr:FUSC family protein [Variovorax sp.]HYP85990.1 FUSC family protein [Variovorax sp.]